MQNHDYRKKSEVIKRLLPVQMAGQFKVKVTLKLQMTVRSNN